MLKISVGEENEILAGSFVLNPTMAIEDFVVYYKVSNTITIWGKGEVYF